ncbi:MAG: lamin tail domain-containing protein [Chitinophagaceae bacterium]|nr:lamin tail domain-containing protein [Chitinophagaceae bacterium]
MKKLIFLSSLLCFFFFKSNSQIIFNEVSANSGNFNGSGGEWIEFKNIDTNPIDLSCWKISNGGNTNISIPAALILPPGAYLILAKASTMMCATCDFKDLNTVFTLNADGFGFGSGAYANTVFLNLDNSASGGCNCLTGSAALNLTDRIVLFNDQGIVQDAILFAGGNNYGVAAIPVPFPNTAFCPASVDTIPAVGDPIYTGREICNAQEGCNSSMSRIPDGNNGAIVTWDNSGNLACTGCLVPCAPLASNTAATDLPTPGLANNSLSYTTTFNGNPLNSATSTFTICGAQSLNFQYQINNYINIALTPLQSNNNFGSYVKIGAANGLAFNTATFNSITGHTILSHTINPPSGTTTYEFVATDLVTNCSSCPGSTAYNTPSNINSTAKECFISRKITINREDDLTGIPTVNCAPSAPGSITIAGVSGSNIRFTLQKQTIAAGPFNTILGPQQGNSFSNIIDDDADPNLPNYQVVITTVNSVCPNSNILTVAVPSSCMGNPPCPLYDTIAPGAPIFSPLGGTSVCKNAPLTFNVNVLKVCGGQVELKYDYNNTFDPYSQGTSLGIVNTTLGAVPAPNVAGGRVYISEFVARPYNTAPCASDGSNANSGEYVELYNPGPGATDISGWMISDGDWTATIPFGTVLGVDQYYLIGGGGTFCATGQTPDLNIETCNCTGGTNNGGTGEDFMNFTNGAEGFGLFDCSNNFIDGVSWSSFAGDATVPASLPGGCGNYLTAKTPVIPVIGALDSQLENTGGSFTGTNGGRARSATGTWTISINNSQFGAGFNGTPKAVNGAFTMWNGGTTPIGTSCPPPPSTASITSNFPDTCNQSGAITIVLKSIFLPSPTGVCLPSAVTDTAEYSIPSCPMLTLTGSGNYCFPDPIPLSISASSPLIGNYDITLVNGLNTVVLNNQTGAGPFTTNVFVDGIWQISSIVPALGNTNCEPDFQGSAEVFYFIKPVITSVPLTPTVCYGINYDLSNLHAQIVTSPPTNNFVWYDVPTGGSPVSTLLNTTTPVTMYVAASSGSPANCEGARVPVTIGTDPIPDIPTITCSGNSITFVQPSPTCIPVNCTGIEYSANGINWLTGPTFTAADPGFAGFGSPTNYTLYMRNTANNQCFNYVTYISSCINNPLPSFIKNFYGKIEEAKQVNLIWDIVNEIYVEKYEIEKSRDGINFENIGEVKAKATNPSEEFRYNKIDYNPYYGKNYYRLKVLDIDGQFTYSKNILIQFGEGTTALQAMYPNPASDILNLDISLVSKEKITIEILNPLGQIVYNQQQLLDAGSNTISLNTSYLVAGNYAIRLKTKTENITRQFIKK